MADSEIKAAIHQALLRVAHRVRARAIDEAPYRTGDLRKSITVIDRGDSISVSAGGDFAPYAVFVHQGTGLYGPRHQKYAIGPKTKKALSWKGAKHPVRKVMHPGIKPNRFLVRAAEKTMPEIDRLVGPLVAITIDEKIQRALKDVKIVIRI